MLSPLRAQRRARFHHSVLARGWHVKAPYAAAAPGWAPGAPAPYGPPVPRPTGSNPTLKIIAGILAIVAAVIVLAGASLPYAHLATRPAC